MAANTEQAFNNEAYSQLKESISSTATQIVLISGGGQEFTPGWNSDRELYSTITDKLGNVEIITITDINLDVLTVQRGQDGSVAQAWTVGALISQRLVAGALDGFLQKEGFRTVAFRPHDTLTADYPGEKVLEIGLDDCHKRWWRHVDGIDWRLIAGAVCPDERLDENGYVIPAWVSYFDDTFWGVQANGTWTGTTWQQVGPGMSLGVKLGSTWANGFRPTHLSVNFLPASPDMGTLAIGKSAGGNDYGSFSPYADGDDVIITVTQNIQRINLYGVGSFEVYDIAMY